ncbi:MAG TPA: hypothetical protein VK986_24735 [Tepidisphaeraceae bacterium]|nr:hypothetical protein [Tepidisphaeraceae bacterium]
MRKSRVSHVTLALVCAIAALPVTAAPPKPVTLDLTAVPLADAIARWEKAAGAKADVAWPTFERIDKNTPVTLRLKDVPADAALRLLMRAAHGGGKTNVWRDGDTVRVTGLADAEVVKPVERTYDLVKSGVGALIQADGDTALELVQRLIMEMVAAETWREAGGAVGGMRIAGRSLVVSTTPVIHDEVAALLGKVRDAAAERPAPAEPAVERTRRALARRLPGTGPTGTMTLGEALDKWHAAAAPGVNVIVDWRVLETGGFERSSPVDIPKDAATKPAGEALAAIFRSIKSDFKDFLGVEIGEAGVLVVSSRDDLERAMAHVRCYNVRALVARPARRGDDPTQAERMEAVIKALSEAVDPPSWRDNGGSIGAMRSLGTVLVINQTPANHERIAAALARFGK